jgi:hypothetical protein
MIKINNSLRIVNKYLIRISISVFSGYTISYVSKLLTILVTAKAFHPSVGYALLFALIAGGILVWLWDLVEEGINFKEITLFQKIYWIGLILIFFISFLFGVMT